jgi:hypothetical protein
MIFFLSVCYLKLTDKNVRNNFICYFVRVAVTLREDLRMALPESWMLRRIFEFR